MSDIHVPGSQRPHADIIKAWADGAEVEFYDIYLERWVHEASPRFLPNVMYRVQPTIITGACRLALVLSSNYKNAYPYVWDVGSSIPSPTRFVKWLTGTIEWETEIE
jgi:hypothetical protein